MIIKHLGRNYKLVYSTDIRFYKIIKNLESLKRKRIKK